MNTQDYERYLEEIVKRSERALDSIGQLNFSVSNLHRLSNQSREYHRFHIEAFRSIHSFLAQTGVISSMLWPEITPGGKSTRDAGGMDLSKNAKNQIAKSMKKKLKPVGRALLRNWKLRERFNEQTEQAWLRSLERDGECHVLGSPLQSGYLSPDKEVCYYDPMSRNFHFKGETYNIQDAAAVIFGLLSFARDEQRKQRASAKRAESFYSGSSMHTTM